MPQKILVIDDEPEFVLMLKTRLQANDFEVITASDGQEGIVKAKNLLPDLIIIDIMMPNMDGGQAVLKLKEDPKTCSIPVIFLTAVLDKNDEANEQKVNIGNIFYPVIAKPFDPEHLLKMISDLLPG